MRNWREKLTIEIDQVKNLRGNAFYFVCEKAVQIARKLISPEEDFYGLIRNEAVRALAEKFGYPQPGKLPDVCI